MEGNFQIPCVVFEVSNIVVYTQTNALVYKNIVVICCPLLWCLCHTYAPEQDATKWGMV
jgi:NADH:ubiquinone oxidoreductase subunit B-like Fe-S oxidoreductase